MQVAKAWLTLEPQGDRPWLGPGAMPHLGSGAADMNEDPVTGTPVG